MYNMFQSAVGVYMENGLHVYYVVAHFELTCVVPLLQGGCTRRSTK